MDTFTPGSAQELERFAQLQERLKPLFERVFPDPLEPRTVVVVPSLSVDQDVVAKISGLSHYEERMLCMLLLLRLPRTRLVYVTSTLLDPTIIDYYLHLLPGVPGQHARSRLTMLTCHDESRSTLTEKILERPRLIQRIRNAIPDPASAHLTCFVVTATERSLAVRLGIPVYGCDPALADLGSKSGSRRVFREAGIAMADGREGLRDMDDVAATLAELKQRHPDLRRAAVKLEEGCSGEGNATFTFEGCPESGPLEAWVQGELPARLRYEDQTQSWERYAAKFAVMGGVVECWVEGQDKRSPSVQCRVDPLGGVELVSTHDQVLGGPTGQIFLGSTFPADPGYRKEIQEAGMKVGAVLRDKGALGRYGVDFVTVREGDAWRNHAIEINLRKGGTTHTLRILQLLTQGTYDPQTGEFFTPRGQSRCYYATDNLENAAYRRLAPEDLMHIGVTHGLHYQTTSQTGVFFHLIGALSGHGKLGVVCVAEHQEACVELYERTVEILDREAAREPILPP